MNFFAKIAFTFEQHSNTLRSKSFNTESIKPPVKIKVLQYFRSIHVKQSKPIAKLVAPVHK